MIGQEAREVGRKLAAILKILASSHEIPMSTKIAAEAIVERLKVAHLCNLVIVGKVSETICEIPVRLSKVGLVLSAGFNAVAAAVEVGVEVTSKPMTGVIDAGKLASFWSL